MPTVLEHLHAAGSLQGRFEQGVTTGAGTTSTLVCSKYANSVLSSSEFATFAVLIESGCCAGEMGMISNTGLATSTGTFTTATTFSAAIASGVAFSLYDRDRLPPLALAGKDGLLQKLSQAHERTWVEDTLSFTGVTSQKHYPVDTAAWPWFTDDTRIIEIQYPVTSSDDVPLVMNRSLWSWVSDGETRKLRFPGAPFKTGETFTVKVNRPGNSRLILNASCRAALTTTTVTSIVVRTGGYYSATPTVSFSGGGGSGAAGTAVLTNGVLTSVTVTNPGTGYTSTPTVTIPRNASDTGWADQSTQTAGLASLTDEAIPDVVVIRPTLLYLLYTELATMGAPGHTKAEWQDLANQWEARAVSKKAQRTPRDANEGVIRLRTTAVRAGRFGRCG